MIDTLISRLTRVKKTGPGRWLACCPAHDDKSPSLAVRVVEDGRILIHCFAECSTSDILGAVGLTFDDLFPARLGDHLPRLRQPFIAMDVLEAISHEALVVAIAGRDAERGVLTDADRCRMMTAVGRISAAVFLAKGAA